MATSYKVLGQSSPTADTPTTIYTCPSATQTVISSIVVANRSDTTSYFRVSVRPNGETLADKHYIAFNSSVSPNNSLFLTVGLTIDAADIIDVYSSSNNLSFSIFGSEIS